MKVFRWKFLVCGWLTSLVGKASAHSVHSVGGSEETGFMEGFLHPILGIDHLVAMLAVGLWGAVLGGKLKWQLPVVFPLVMAVGGVLGIQGLKLPMVEIWIALSAVVIGSAVVFRWPARPWTAWLIVGVFAVFHGHAHGTELPAAAAPEVYALGFVVSTGLLHLAGIGIGELDRWKGCGDRVIRFVGGVIAAVGIIFLISNLEGWI